MDSTYFLLDSFIIIVNRVIILVNFGNEFNDGLNIFFYTSSIFFIANRYNREQIERSKFLETNNNSEWVNVIDNMYNAVLIVSKWD